jgi:phage tail-like protein
VSFLAEADVVGGRVKLSFDATGAAVIRRKRRDFEFPAEGFVAYDDREFPPPGTEVTEVDLGTTIEDGQRTVRFAESVSRDGSEILRRTTATTFDALGAVVARRIEVLDYGMEPGGLTPGVPLYYQLGSDRAVATPGAAHGSGRDLYARLPAFLHRTDTVARAPGLESIPEAAARSGQLRRFVDLFGAGLDAVRSSADGLRDLHNVDEVDHRRLPLLARWIGWELSEDAPIPVQRHEIRHAAALYRITGTIPGCRLWVKRLTGWDAEVKEFARNVLRTNDLGNPSDPADRGSCTVDTSDTARLARRGTAQDDLDYTLETGPEARFANNAVGLFVTPGADETAAEVARKRARLVAGASRFMPFNVRAVVIEDVPVIADTRTVALSLQESSDQEGGG